jgi:hypothetical protein
MSALSAHISRCRSLQLEVTIGFLPGFRNIPIFDALRLEHFTVNMCGIVDEDVYISMLQQLTSLPSLRRFSCTSHTMLVIEGLLKFSDPAWLGRLEEIELHCPITTEQAFELLKQCTSATHITLGELLPDVATTTDIPPPFITPSTMSLPNLHFLDISSTSNSYCPLLHHISAPTLQVLRVSGLHMSDLSDTILTWANTLNFLKARLSTHGEKLLGNDICVFLNKPDILRIPLLEIKIQSEFECWDEYDGWSESSISESSLRAAAEDFNKSQEGHRRIGYDSISGWNGGHVLSWVDGGIRHGKRISKPSTGDGECRKNL